MHSPVFKTLSQIRSESQPVLVVGLGISGIETAKFLLDVGITPRCVEKTKRQVYLERSKYSDRIEELERLGAELFFDVDGEHVSQFLDRVSLAVCSPGVGLETAVVGAIEARGVVVISELELGIELHRGQKIVVTGSIGKSTTVSLLHEVILQGGRESILCGNVGTPVIASPHLRAAFLETEPQTELPILVVEASSYQLESCSVLQPDISIFLNLVENHLERHGTMERYGAAKTRVFRNQDSEQLLIAGFDDSRVRALVSGAASEISFFGATSNSDMQRIAAKSCSLISGNNLEYRNAGKKSVFDVSNSRLIGAHNRLNMAAVIIAAKELAIEDSVIERTIKTFSPLEHRVEVLERKAGAPIVVNDSKSTTVASSLAALETVFAEFPEHKVSLMLGGLSKAGSWQPLFEAVKSNQQVIAQVICFGKDAALIASNAKAQEVECIVLGSMQEALAETLSKLGVDDLLLFSPGCASFDGFTDFEHRGRVFKEIVSGRV